jgi:putative nucleotidyltransferase with HDIG domain
MEPEPAEHGSCDEVDGRVRDLEGLGAISRSALWSGLTSFAKFEHTINALVAHHPATMDHMLRTRDLAFMLSHVFGLGEHEARRVGVAALLHDVGKLSISRQVLDAPRRLTQPEWEIIRAHPTVSARIAESAGCPDDVCALIEQHHERSDGSGYPNGLFGEFSLVAQIVIVTDVWDAMSAARPYRDSAVLFQRQRVLAALGFERATNALLSLVGNL